MEKISVVINTFNEEENLPRAIASVKGLADEVVVVDMYSTDKTVEVANKLGARVYEFDSVGYVEPARNFAISKAENNWIFILDADEELSSELKENIKLLIEDPKADFFRIPRKNIIFNKWIKHTLWWPDYQIRLFRKGKVLWTEVIHSVPMSVGTGVDIVAEENMAILHHNYSFVEEYLDRLNRYTTIQANLVFSEGNEFSWKDLIVKPWKEFVGRYFVGEGYKDGVHGLALSLLQSFSELVTYVKVWQKNKFVAEKIEAIEVVTLFRQKEKELFYFQADLLVRKTGSLVERIKRKFRIS